MRDRPYEMKMKTKSIALIGVALSGVSFAGEEIVPATPTAVPSGTRSWCDAFETLGTPIYQNADNAFLQELKFFGRAQWQYAYVDGEDSTGNSFHDSFDDWRRVRIGAQAKFLNYFTLKGNIDLSADRRPAGGHTDFGYQRFYELKLTTDLGKMFDVGGLDSLKMTYGRQKLAFTPESHTSSKKIKTPERSALSNKMTNSANPTGFRLDAERGAFSYAAGVYGEYDRETLGDFDNGLTYYAGLGFEATETAEYMFEAAYNDSDSGTRADFLRYDWALSMAGQYDYGRFEIMWNAIYGDNGGSGAVSGDFWGLVVMPSYWIFENQLEAVVRYQYAGAEDDEGIRLNARYLRLAGLRGRADFGGSNGDSGRGDEHHSIYGGLNWYLCGHNLKLMSGVEYETLDAPSGDAEATTLWFAARTYF